MSNFSSDHLTIFSKTFFVSISSEVDPEPLHTVVEGSEREMPLRRLGEMSSPKDLLRKIGFVSTNLKQVPRKPSSFQDHWCGRSDFLHLRRGKDILQSYCALPVTVVPLRCTWLMNTGNWRVVGLKFLRVLRPAKMSKT